MFKLQMPAARHRVTRLKVRIVQGKDRLRGGGSRTAVIGAGGRSRQQRGRQRGPHARCDQAQHGVLGAAAAAVSSLQRLLRRLRVLILQMHGQSCDT